MWKRKAAVLSLIFFAGIHPSGAQTVTTDTALQNLPARWDLQNCLEYAIKNNITINTFRLQQASAQQDLLGAKAAMEPDLAGAASGYLTYRKQANGSGGYGGRKVTENGNYSLNSSIIVYQGGYLRNNIREKQLLTQTAGLDILQQENDLTLNVTQAFLNILLAKENIIYLQDLVNTSAEQVKQARQKYDVGTIALKDLAQLQAQNANDKYSLVTAQNTHRQNIISLKQLLQLPSAVEFQVQEPDTLISKALVPDLREVQQQALAVRPEVKIGDINVDIARTDLQLAKSGFRPTLTGSGSIGANHSGGDPGILQQLDNSFYQQIGLSLSIPIFTRRVVRTNVEKARIQIDQAQLDQKNIKNNLSLQVEQAYVNVVNAQGQYDAAVEQLTATKESYRIANEQLKVGAIATVDYLIQKNLYTQAYQQYVQAKYNAALTIRIYDFYRGVPIKL
ncbi:TolC family protein [Flavitalea sp. BT771]|uniref:TolC family protein n=1 Tax=Flavitalea sp. BT771 TaxID=3063329 RepID=UPI0026E42376|nr:TolC family protein [Flavitalea sp. BT771]MDO6434225.1 TolC family protein [Flavitalea sp. BT771]MDV6223125.1 TolC family protein [Flavitalea sp. BT771]